jgi:hypothetical protein
LRNGFPFRQVGPVSDYFGPVAPYVMALDELERVIEGGLFPLLAGFMVGLEPRVGPAVDDLDREFALSVASRRTSDVLADSLVGGR